MLYLVTTVGKECSVSLLIQLLSFPIVTGDVFEFYETPIETITPYESLQRMPDLPPNLHAQKDPVRFHPGINIILFIIITNYARI